MPLQTIEYRSTAAAFADDVRGKEFARDEAVRYGKMIALSESKKPGARGACCVFDIDDTLVSSTDESPIQSAVDLFKECGRLGMDPYIVTARPDDKHTKRETKAMLKDLGIVYEAIFFMPSDLWERANSKIVSEYKYAARKFINRPVLLNIGDMWTDHVRFPVRDDAIYSLKKKIGCAPSVFFKKQSHNSSLTTLHIKLPEADDIDE